VLSPNAPFKTSRAWSAAQQALVVDAASRPQDHSHFERWIRRGCYFDQAGYPVPALLLQETDTQELGKPFEIIKMLEGQALWSILASFYIRWSNMRCP